MNPLPAQSLPLAESPPDSASPHVLTVAEAARELRCSKAHVHHLITGKVRGVSPLPSLWLGRRRLIVRASFVAWIRANERRQDKANEEKLQCLP